MHFLKSVLVVLLIAMFSSSLYACDLPNIIKQPENVTIKSGKSATFKIVLSDSSQVSYQWRENGLPIKGATKSFYSLPKVSLTDNNKTYDVVIFQGCGSNCFKMSIIAKLTVK